MSPRPRRPTLAEALLGYPLSSARHVWRFPFVTSDTQRCDRCGRSFVPRADTSGPYECVPTPEWRASHPNDDGGTR